MLSTCVLFRIRSKHILSICFIRGWAPSAGVFGRLLKTRNRVKRVGVSI